MMSTPPEGEFFRGFIALSLPSVLQEALSELQNRLRAQWQGDWIRWTRPAQIHLTLKFLGNVRRSQITLLTGYLNQAAAAIDPFDLSASRLGCFPSPARPRVLWIGLEGDTGTLGRLQKQVQNLTASISPEKEEREFHPHLTLARITRWDREVRHLPAVIENQHPPPSGKWRVETIELYESALLPQGPVYTRLHSALFAGK